MRLRAVVVSVLVNGILVLSPAIAQVLVFPHLADGILTDGSRTRWATEIKLLNSTSRPNSIVVSFFNADGSPKRVGIPELAQAGRFIAPRVFGTRFSIDLSGNAAQTLTLDSGWIGFQEFPRANTGWALVEGGPGIKCGDAASSFPDSRICKLAL